jgi:multicomponent Na+:H+ antiporter subunit C
MELLTAIGIGFLFSIGIFQVLRRNVIRSVIGILIMMNAVNLFLISSGTYIGINAPYTTYASQSSDALPQAVVLTAIVIGLGGFSFVLSLLFVISKRYQTTDQDQINQLKH